MKYLLPFIACLTICSIIADAQSTDTTFQKQWHLIDSLIIKKNLPKSALAKVDKLYEDAKRRNLDAQVIKALLYKLSLQDKTGEDDINSKVTVWNKEIADTRSVVQQSILDVLLAETLKNYYSGRNSWEIDSWSKTSNYTKADITTWNTDDFYNYISALYTKALFPVTLLQQAGLSQYGAIIIKGNASYLRPTLYDLLANMALDFYKDKRPSRTEPSDAFELKDTMALAGVDKFDVYNFSATDTFSGVLKTLKIYQRLILFHKQKNDTAALIDIDLDRIGWVNDNAVFDNKEIHYRAALEDVAHHYPDHPQATQAWYLLINMIADKARAYRPFEDTANRYGFVTTRRMIVERLKAQPAESEGNSNMKQLLNEIESKSLYCKAEIVNVPGQPFRMQVQYKNVDTLYCRVIDKELVDTLRSKSDNFWKKVSSLPYCRSFVQALPKTGDYQNHKVEIKVDALPAGQYVLLESNTASFADSTSKLLTQEVAVSHLSYINKGKDYFVLDRETGKPLKGVKVIIVQNYYNNTKHDWENEIMPAITTGKDGYFIIPSLGKPIIYYSRVSIKLIDGEDTLPASGSRNYSDSRQNVTVSNQNNTNFEKENALMHLYLDRAIYRPGQKIFFKGIAITEDSTAHVPKLYKTIDSLCIYLEDVNNKKIDSVSLRPNEYGSVAGSFVLPAHTLTGNFRLIMKDIEGWQTFRVEEYKRPTFYIQFDTLKSAYRLRDTIVVTGFAQAFAGNFLNNAQVKYNVQRVTRYIFSSREIRNNFDMPSKQIIVGTVATDGGGKFKISFPSLPDDAVDTSTHPIFDFKINVSATDAGGETREASSLVSVGYRSLIIKADVPSIAESKDFNKIPVSVKNLSGEEVDAKVHITVYPLQSPGRTIRERYWDRPDMFVMSREIFVQNFPYDEYDNERDKSTWQKGPAVINGAFNTIGGSSFTFTKALSQGWYETVVATTDKDGHETKDIEYTEMYDALSPGMPANNDNFVTAVKTRLHPGDKASLVIGSGFSDVYILRQTDKPSLKMTAGNLQSFRSFMLDNNKQQIEEPVTEDDRGGFGIYYAFVKHNRFYSGGETFTVPWDDKDLRVQYITYRNKTEPGSKEEWSIKIKGANGDTNKAELLTAMYDASLNQFAPNKWYVPDIWKNYYGNNNWESTAGFSSGFSNENRDHGVYTGFKKVYDKLATSVEDLWSNVIKNSYYIEGKMFIHGQGVQGEGARYNFQHDMNPDTRYELKELRAPLGMAKFDESDLNPYRGNQFVSTSDTIKFYTKAPGLATQNTDNTPFQLRTNFNETAFFFPQVYADSAGNYNINFTMPESLTKWKWISLAHTKDLSFGMNEATIITQKTLMVQPNMPRFLREGDQMELTARISNTGDSALTGQVSLELIDASTNKPVDGLFQSVFPDQYLTAEAGQTTVVKFPVVIPFNYHHALTYRVIAKTGSFNDGEENTLPVLTNRMLVTESLPLYIKGDTTEHFTFDKLLNTQSETLQTQSLTVEYTANPVWTAVQSLPYLMEYPYECAEQTFNRFYANALAAYIVRQYPRIKDVFSQWLKVSPKGGDLEGALSNLDKNQELKQLLIEETPWALDAQNETQQKKNIALLFDMVKMSNDARSALNKLRDMQLSDGSFAWFKGGYADRYITQYILTGIGRLQELATILGENSTDVNTMITKALNYLDDQVNKDYNELVKYKVDLSKDNLSQEQIQYLFMRSYFTTIPVKDKKAYNYFYQQAMKYWQHQSVYMKGMISLALIRTAQQAFVLNNIYPSIIENAVATKEKGMYWKDNEWGYYWYQAPIEQQALLIELADAVAATKQKAAAQTDADEMKTWLINQKQTTSWQTTKATADACYALLLNSDVQMNNDRKVTVQLGSYSTGNDLSEAGTGYFKKALDGDKVVPAMGNITVTVQTPGIASKNTSPSYGAVYWQYFEDMDKITGAATSLLLHKKLFIENNTSAGKALSPVNEDSVLHVGDRVIVRMELKTDRNLEYIHLKDMRAAAMEPVNVLSEYKWQDGLGYYESTKDASTDFFIGNMPKGTYVFEYPVYITHVGTFSSGIATIQCMYAPQFTSHSEGLKIVVE